MTMPYPDLRHFTLRDYGNRVGIYRFFDAFKRYGIQPTFAINAQLAERYPVLLRDVLEHGGEVLGHSWNMDTPHAGGLDEAVEADTIRRSLDRLRAITGQPVRGWLSPGRLESPNTPELLKSQGIEYFCDWVNDDMPYAFHTRHGDLWAMPLPTEIEDRFVIMDNQHAEASWAQQVIDAGQMLLAEARQEGGRILSLSIHPWVLGQPHRIKHLETVLEALSGEPEVWCAGAGEILDSFVSQA
jgi:peptidoglycan/xylan/chitin deacetylase (PgdA/CDA1 family)